MNETNWGGNVDYSAKQVLRPDSLSQLQELVASADQIRAVGSRHSFNRIADSQTMLDPTALPEIFEVGAGNRTVRVNGAVTYGRLAERLAPLGLTLANFSSLPHISVAGAVATGTHGSGRRNQNLAAAVKAVQIVSGEGELIELAAGDESFDGAVVSLGALGVVTAIDLEVVPMFEVGQTVHDGIAIEDLAANPEALLSAAYSVSVFTTWLDGAAIDERNQVWVKRRADDEPSVASESLLSRLPKAKVARHPIKGIDASSCTAQLGELGPPVDRLPHFRLDFTPSAGDEIQSEFFVEFDDAADVLRAVAAIGEEIADALLISEIRTVAADRQWMSPHFGRDSLALHFTWRPDQTLAEEAARRVGAVLAPFNMRPHWGKVFDHRQFDVRSIPHRNDFLDLVHQFDPAGTFSNEWFETVVRASE